MDLSVRIPEDIQFGLLERSVGSEVGKKIREDYQSKIKHFSSGFVLRSDGEGVLAYGYGKEEGVNCMKNSHLIEYDSGTGEVIKDSFGVSQIRRPKSVMPWSGKIAIGVLSVVGIPWLIYDLLPSTRRKEKEGIELCEISEDIIKANMEDLRGLVEPLKIYSGSLEEVEGQMGGKLEYVDTGSQETFLSDMNSFWLKGRAALLGADALIHYNHNIASEQRSRVNYDNPDDQHMESYTHRYSVFQGTPVKFKEAVVSSNL